MASGGPDIWHEVTVLEAQVKRLVNNDLKEICRGENLAVSGVKAVLQQRILAGKLSSVPHDPCSSISPPSESCTDFQL